MRKADRTVYKSCVGLEKKLKREGEHAEKLIFLLPRLRAAKREFSSGGNTAFAEGLLDFLRLYDFNPDEKSICTHLRGVNAEDDVIRKLYYYFIYCACLQGSEKSTAFLRRCESFDYDVIIRAASETERKLMRFPDYEKSDDATRVAYRRGLCSYAGSIGKTPAAALKSLSHDTFSQTLLKKKSLTTPYFLMLFLFVLFFSSLLYIMCDDIFAVLICLIPMYEAAKFCCDMIFGSVCTPRPPYRLKENDLPSCLTVITALLDGGESCLAGKIESYMLSNRGEGRYFGILADLPDSGKLTASGDEAVIKQASDEIEKLNRKYGGGFFLFYRSRAFSASEEKFIAPERKRGAVCELVRLIYSKESCLQVVGGKLPDKLEYLVTLDSDTELIPGALSGMLSAAAHPYNKPVIDMKKRTVISGHGIMQPRVGVKPGSAFRTLFSCLTSGTAGISAYRSASYDTYDMISGTGVFCGKGIINVEAFYYCACDTFPDNKVLSHDIPEGCRLRCGMISDVTLYDGTPKNAVSYYRRQHRWIRGDIQALYFVMPVIKDRSGRPHINPLTALDKYKMFDNVRRVLLPQLSLLAFIYGVLFPNSRQVMLFALLYLLLPIAFDVIRAVISGAFHRTTASFSGIFSPRRRGALSVIMFISFLPYEAWISFSASITALFRMISGKKLLQWTTAAATDGKKSSPYTYLARFLLSCVLGTLLLFFSPSVFSGLVSLCFLSSPVLAYFTSEPLKSVKRSKGTYGELYGYAFDHMKYFSDFVTAEHSYLPPDNYQETASVGIAARTSPTNIGLYLLAEVAAVDMGISVPEELYDRLCPTIKTIKSLTKKNGKLYNWYDTRTRAVIGNFVSTVDCGNYLCCLITLYPALLQYGETDARLIELAIEVKELIEECDISELYDVQRDLFYIGSGDVADNHYDLYESEMRTTEIAAVALGFAPPRHIGYLGKPVIRYAGYAGIASWGGTAFEYFMPQLFLYDSPWTLCGEAADFARRAQRAKRARLGDGYVFGTSESCYFAFDKDMNYQYKTHGVGLLALANGEDDELVISPYSSFLMADGGGVFEDNLERLKDSGAYGKYGFYEAVDLTPSRVGGGYAFIRCYMAHHIAMSIIACANLVCDGIFRKRFCSDVRIAAHLPLLYELFPTDAAPYKKPEKFIIPKRQRNRISESSRACVISNTVCSAYCDDTGVALYRRGTCIARRGRLLTGNSEVVDLFRHPLYLSDNRAEYKFGQASAAVGVSDDKNVFYVKVSGAVGGCALSLEVILNSLLEYDRHAALSGLFITAAYEDKTLFFTRRRREGKPPLTVAACAFSDKAEPVWFFTRAEEVMSFNSDTELFSVCAASECGACIFPYLYMKTDCEDVTFFIAVAKDKQSACGLINSVSALPPVSVLPEKGYTFLQGAADEPTFADVMYMYMHPRASCGTRTSSSLPENLLWRYGISGDLPILCFDARGKGSINQTRAMLPMYLRVHKTSLIKGLSYDFVILYDGDDPYYRKCETELKRIIGACGSQSLLGVKGGVYTVQAGGDIAKYLTGISFYVYRAADNTKTAPQAEKTEHRTISAPLKASDEMKLITDSCAVLPYRKCAVPRSFIYANPSFGTLVTDRSAGFTFYENSRMMRLTEHDTTLSSPHERVILKADAGEYDLLACASVCRFYTSYALYEGFAAGGHYTVRICVDGKLPYKVISVDCEGNGILYYEVIPVLDAKRSDGTLTSVFRAGTLFISSAYKSDGFLMFLNCKGSKRADYDGKTARIYADGQSASFILGTARSKPAFDVMIKSGIKAQSVYAARAETYLSPFRLISPDKALDTMFNTYAPYQTLFCRMYARCGYYQLGGAYGFRDQLQDCLCAMYGDPVSARAQIIRACAHQYEQGDVMHWWHSSEKKGVRTRCSDDMLWLVFVTEKFISVTGDTKLLKMQVPFISSPELDKDERDRYEKAVRSPLRASVYEHCKRALTRGVRRGIHGLCLMGGGDWNDGMDKAGINGRGESVWLSFFALACLKSGSKLARLMGDDELAGAYLQIAEEINDCIEKYGFDGHYIRGYLDNGEMFGAPGCEACEIDIIPQAFAAMFGKNDERIKASLNEAYEKLFDRESKVFRLFYPPFDGQENIGYIASYPPGIRENGGQYTHGGIWGAAGYLAAGQNARGYEILSSLNPLSSSRDTSFSNAYKGEEYVFAGDVYTSDGVYGHCGWSWYTGSAGWFFTTVLQQLLGYDEKDGGFEINPRLCTEFSRFTLVISRHKTEYTVNVQGGGKKSPVLDGHVYEGNTFRFDKGCHTLEISI